ncbi:MAG: sigma-70 family RNA polymerase sigma factor [Gemmobacter sp.]
MAEDGFEARLAPLWRAGCEGDEVAYRAALSLIARRLRAYFRARMGGLPDDVEDMVQETLLAIHLKRATHDPGLPVSNWLHAVARYRLTDLYRRRGRRGVPESLDGVEVESPAGAEGVDAAVARRDLGRLLGTLPDGQRQAIELVKVQGYSTEEAATRMGITVTTLKVRVHRGLQRLMAVVGAEP